MKRKFVSVLLLIVMISTVVLTACSSNKSGTTTPSSSPAGEATGSNTAEETPDGTDHSAEKVTISFIENGWVNTPTDDNDPWRKWMNETYNVDFKLSAYPEADLESKLMVQFASNDPPDIFYAWDIKTVKKLYKQGVLLEDWTPYLDKIPTLSATFTKQSKAYVNEGGKMIGLPTIPTPNTFSYKVRQDWLDHLKLQSPTTPDELLNVLRKFTHDDPDQNQKNDTWGISSAGAGANLGELSRLELMFGRSGIFVNNNQVESSIVNGTHKKMLDFVKVLVDEKLIDPDWYTQGWEQRKPKLFAGKVGVTFYPGVLVNEVEGGNGATGSTIGWFENMPMPKAGPDGGKLQPGAIASGIISISKKAAEDPVKLERILKIIEASTYPNDGYWALRWGVGVNGQKVMDVEGGGKFVSLKGELYRQDNKGAYDWGTWVSTGLDGVVESTNEQPGESDKKQMRLDSETKQMPANPNDMALLSLDPQIVSDLDTLQNEFDIKYILGGTKDYDGFVEQWLKTGGQTLLDQATEQYTAAGLIN
ncbi:extracellular solute-binding protein [Cohnella silvisoli]|uniref:Extracellular solute-binding protein n=1 Tax=Cohnella silvisoli TaxID=2873699 RepID=A0ABV1KMI5_9BACL|nr:extracellular solute-binding protein [Cohnella silvisoli]MCD9020386.1 extracellular solute-binding protein [Cohnella silvisoli]